MCDVRVSPRWLCDIVHEASPSSTISPLTTTRFRDDGTRAVDGVKPSLCKYSAYPDDFGRALAKVYDQHYVDHKLLMRQRRFDMLSSVDVSFPLEERLWEPLEDAWADAELDDVVHAARQLAVQQVG